MFCYIFVLSTFSSMLLSFTMPKIFQSKRMLFFVFHAFFTIYIMISLQFVLIVIVRICKPTSLATLASHVQTVSFVD